MIGYVIEQELGNLLPVRAAVRHPADDDRGRPRTTRRSRTRPSRSVRSTTGRPPRRWPPSAAGRSPRTATTSAAWWPSPRPQADLRDPADPQPARAGHDRDLRRRRRRSRRCTTSTAELHGVEAVIDKDLASALLADRARGRPAGDRHRRRRRLHRLGDARAAAARHQVTPEELEGLDLPAGSMGPKVEAACGFVRAHRQAGRDRFAGRHRPDRRRARPAPASHPDLAVIDVAVGDRSPTVDAWRAGDDACWPTPGRWPTSTSGGCGWPTSSPWSARS